MEEGTSRPQSGSGKMLPEENAAEQSMSKEKLELFAHNQRAYESAIALMEEEGQAAVIHPTGTGKSFIAFRLAEEHPESRILWLSPSEYIYQTQVQNLRRVLPQADSVDRILAGIRFMTYSKLMMNDQNKETPRSQRGRGGKQPQLERQAAPDFIILDEFHRCGASEWEKSVRKLLADCPDAKVLGLSATSIRYLDGQRDMAQELFEGCIASEMSLGEAIAREILPTPEYVISLYSCQEELKRLRKRIEETKNPGLRKENERLLEELRRTLENAEGLDRIFYKHMKNPDGSIRRGRYIVFCAGREHMEEMMEKAREWFSLVDAQPHIYGVYYNNPQTSKEFHAFQEDESEHLRLLFCIDMLNEGVHVDGIDGVILLRPTISPIVYLQQIGRALSAEKKNRSPIIFDIVNNFEGLYTIDSLRFEIEEAFSAIPYSEAERKRFHDRFHIYDEVKNCRELFDRIHQNLAASWELYYQAAECYYREHGDLRIVKSHVTDTGLTVGTWLMTQRRIRAGKVAGKLTEEQIQKLDAIGMEWESGSDRKWRRGYEALCHYKEQYGNVDVKCLYVTEDGYPLGKWVSNIRSKWNRGEFESVQQPAPKEASCPQTSCVKESPALITVEQQRLLEKLGMIWDKRVYKWEVNFHNAEQYFREYGNLNPPRSYKAADGSTLRVWLDNQRQIYAGNKKGAAPLSRQQIERLESIGMIWRKDATWRTKSRCEDTKGKICILKVNTRG